MWDNHSVIREKNPLVLKNSFYNKIDLHIMLKNNNNKKLKLSSNDCEII